ncbi:SCO7613 C-terminal domain-containing membrane protein [Asanoa iriomotensis]|uniref:Membrane protein DUF2157 n=1 Tax=Asanoa iriomotensis TaxID=234613 RepID=A0ABQ4C2Z2_9ACTN|nr:hypothetical protein [Asanoa iriomotensis]GIF57138.1 hypothetical protein Air01nite_32330 [Asanoa iriomotensis]
MTYPCPSCHAPATLATGCPNCGRGPDPDAAEVLRLNAELAELSGPLEEARRAYADLSARYAAVNRRREEVAARVRAAAFLAGPPAPAPVAPPRAETSPRTAQNVLFVLGGLLVGAAAIVFTGVAWATYGVGARAVILAAVTALMLAVPPLTARRGLRSTAETFAALGMLLVVLDGYAAWYADLFGIGAVDGALYAAVVCVVTAAVGSAYGRLTGLGAPGLAALVAAQPVLPLLAYWLDATAWGWALMFACTAALDLALVRTAGLPLRVLGWIGFGCAQVASGVCALAVLVFDDGTPVLLTGVPTLLVAVLLAAAGPVGRVRWLSVAGAATVPPAVAVAVLRPVTVLAESVLLVTAAGVVLAIALVALRLRVARIGALITAGAFLTVPGLMAVAVAVETMVGSLPPFVAGGPVSLTGDWQLPVALVLGAVALGLLVPPAARTAVAVGGGLLVVLALPTSLAMPWWAVSTLDLAVAAVVVLVARPALETTLAAAALAGHAVVVGLARPWSTAAVFGALALLGAAAAVRTRRGAAWWCAVGLAAVPAAVAATVYAAGAGGAWPARAGLAAVAVPLGATLLFGRLPRLVGYATPAVVALATCAAVAGGWPALSEVDEPAGVYPSVALLVLAVALLVRPAAVGRLVVGVAAVPVAALSLFAAAPALGTVLFAPYAWWDHAWTGAPSGVGLTPSNSLDITAGPAATLLILAAAALALFLRPDTALAHPAGGGVPATAGGSAVVRSGIESGDASSSPIAHGADDGDEQGSPGTRPADTDGSPTDAGLVGAQDGQPLVGGAHAGVLAVLAGFLGLGGLLAVLVVAAVPWPVVPAVALAAGIACALTAAVRSAAGAVVPAALLIGSGFSGLLPTEPATLAALGALIAAGAVVGAAGTAEVARVAGWLATVVAATNFAVAAVLAADLPLRRASFPVLAVGAVALGLGYLLRRKRPGVEGPAVDAFGHVAVLPALVLTWNDARTAAAVATIWGAVLGIRAVLPAQGARWRLGFGAAGAELLAWWLLLLSEDVALREAYTLPAAGIALAAGYIALLRDPRLGSWLALGPGLAAALLPSLTSILVADGQLIRRVLLGAGAVAIVLIGTHRRWRAPVVAGGLTLVVLTIHELAVWDLLPRWAYLAGGGLILISVAMTYERRRRDLRKVRGALARMT